MCCVEHLISFIGSSFRIILCMIWIECVIKNETAWGRKAHPCTNNIMNSENDQDNVMISSNCVRSFVQYLWHRHLLSWLLCSKRLRHSLHIHGRSRSWRISTRRRWRWRSKALMPKLGWWRCDGCCCRRGCRGPFEHHACCMPFKLSLIHI